MHVKMCRYEMDFIGSRWGLLVILPHGNGDEQWDNGVLEQKVMDNFKCSWKTATYTQSVVQQYCASQACVDSHLLLDCNRHVFY
jgi:hypothetical protein